jgi:hypothetical protein
LKKTEDDIADSALCIAMYKSKSADGFPNPIDARHTAEAQIGKIKTELYPSGAPPRTIRKQATVE